MPALATARLPPPEYAHGRPAPSYGRLHTDRPTRTDGRTDAATWILIPGRPPQALDEPACCPLRARLRLPLDGPGRPWCDARRPPPGPPRRGRDRVVVPPVCPLR